MGTPEFAVPSLEILADNGYQVVAVITAPDKPQGRGQKVMASPVKSAAIARNIPVLQPEKLKSPEFLAELASYKADVQVVVAFRMLPEIVWSMPPLGTFNLHGSLLPQYRGAAPIHWAVINGEKKTGVTTFLLKHEIDTGSILFQQEEPISDTDTTGTVYERLMHTGATLVRKTIDALASGEYTPMPQPESDQLFAAPKLFRETCEINWNQPADKIRNFVRGLNPSPGAWCTLKGLNMKIHEVKSVMKAGIELPGDINTDQKTFLHVKASVGWVEIVSFQPEGKKRMTPEEFFRGNKI